MLWLWNLVASHEPLRFSLDDLHQADTKGRWWLVGAAWGGNPLVDAKENNLNSSSGNGTTKTSAKTVENQLVALARKQGMNTEVRRSVFVVLMSSDVRFYIFLMIYSLDAALSVVGHGRL